jgi:hypothetical protein
MKNALIYLVPMHKYGAVVDRSTDIPLGTINISDELECKYRILEELSLLGKMPVDSDAHQKIDALCMKYESEINSEILSIVENEYPDAMWEWDKMCDEIEFQLVTDADKRKNIHIVVYIYIQ